MGPGSENYFQVIISMNMLLNSSEVSLKIFVIFSAFLQEMRSYSSLCWLGGLRKKCRCVWLVCHKTKMAITFE
jgi:hypothetical protein